MMPILRKVTSNKRILRYGLVGGLAFTVEYISFLLLIKIIPGPYTLTAAQSLSFSLGLVVSFTGSRLFTFSGKDVTYVHSVSKQIGSYIILAFINLVLSNVAIYGMVHYLSAIPFIAKFLVMSLVVVWNFLIFNKVIFKSE